MRIPCPYDGEVEREDGERILFTTIPRATAFKKKYDGDGWVHAPNKIIGAIEQIKQTNNKRAQRSLKERFVKAFGYGGLCGLFAVWL